MGSSERLDKGDEGRPLAGRGPRSSAQSTVRSMGIPSPGLSVEPKANRAEHTELGDEELEGEQLPADGRGNESTAGQKG